jgi:hypothetical protein
MTVRDRCISTAPEHWFGSALHGGSLRDAPRVAVTSEEERACVGLVRSPRQ